MALYEDLRRHDRRERVVAATYNPPHPMRASRPVISLDEVIRGLRLVLLAFLLLCWMAGAYAGIVYWSLQGSLLGVLASAIVPGLAATSTWWGFTALESPRERCGFTS
jgi:hypothetical protein